MVYLFSALINVLIISLIIHFKKYIKFYDYKNIQKAHSGFVPRLGGFSIILSTYLSIYIFFEESFLLKQSILFSTFLILIVCTKEDLFGNVKASIRFITIFISSFLVIYNLDSLPRHQIPVFEFIFEFRLLEIIFYSLALTAIANGINMIDGTNGLAALTTLSMILSMIIVSISNEEYLIIENLLVIASVTLTFLFFNFLFGSIFLGDTGAYWLGWINGILLIYFFSANEHITTWSAILISSYPIIEVSFSMIRKILKNKSPFKADHNHIHTKLYFLLKKNNENQKSFNSLTTICLMPLWFIPVSVVAWVDKVPVLVLFALLIQFIIYLMYYFILPSPPKNKVDIYNKYF